MKKYFIISLLSTIINANAFLFSDTVLVNDARLHEEVKLSVSTYKVWNPAPTIILLHGCDGPNRNEGNWARVINSWGYNAVFPDSFGPRKVNNVCASPSLVTPVQRSEDISAVANWIDKQKWHKGKIGIIGISHGGWTVMQASNYPTTDKIAAMVAYYPWCDTNFENPKIPVQIHIGSKDFWTPADRCTAIKDSFDLYVYEGATHAFDVDTRTRKVNAGRFGEHILEYDSRASRIAEQHSRDFFKKHLD